MYQAILYEKELMIPMSDGVRLAADVYRPAVGGTPFEENLPLLLQRTPYNKSADRFVEYAQFFAENGYIAVVQDCRGRYGSEGVFTKYLNEPRDGYDTVEWLAKLPYTNGKIGMWGCSYGAHVQACAAKTHPPHLAALVLHMGGTSDSWDHSVRNHGAFELKQITWAFRQVQMEADDLIIREMMSREAVADWLTAFPLKKGLNPLSYTPNFEDYIFEMMTHADFDDYWRHRGLNWREYYGETADIPMLHISGWYDAYCRTATDNYSALSKLKRSPIGLLLGQWIHGPTEVTYNGEVEFGADSAVDLHQLHLRWFGHFLKGEENGIGQEQHIKVFIMGTGDGHKDDNGRLYHGGYWRTGEEWPLPGTELTEYYLHYDGSLRTEQPGADDPSTTYTYDPRHPVPTIGGSTAASLPIFIGGAFDQREREYRGDPERGFYGSRPPYLPLKARHDVVVFQTEPLKERVEVVGPIAVKLFVSSTAVDTDFTAKLVDVYPPSRDFPSGFEMNLTDGILRMRYCESPSRQVLMTPGTIYEIVIEPFPIGNVFKEGHRIRIDISSSNFPHYDVNPNTGEPLGLHRRMIAADNTIHHDLANPSHVVLPLVAHG